MKVVLVLMMAASPVFAQSNAELMYALLTNQTTGKTMVEVLDPNPLSRVRVLDVGYQQASSLSVAPDGRRLYIADRGSNRIAIFDALSGNAVGNIAVNDPKDLALSPDGYSLYVSTGQAIQVFDTGSLTLQQMFSTNPDVTYGIALSPDGRTLAVASGNATGAAAYVFDAVGLNLRGRVAIANAGDPASCQAAPTDVVFTNTGRLLLWDSTCDNMYEANPSLMTQGATIRTARDGMTSPNFNTLIAYSAVTGEAYAVKQSGDIAILGLSSGTAAAVSSTGGVIPAMNGNGSSLFLSVSRNNTLSRVSTATRVVTPGVYSFAASDVSVRDMKILPASVAQLSGTRVVFPPQAIGTTSSVQSVTMTNTGGGLMVVDAVVASGDFIVANTDCAGRIAAGGSCTIRITFRPTAAGVRTGRLTVTSNAMNGDQFVDLSGDGSPLADTQIAVSQTTLTFANQPLNVASAASPIVITNSGATPLVIANIVTTGDFSQTNDCLTTLPASAKCTINVRFTPTAPGPRTGSIRITGNFAGSPTSVALSGNPETPGPVPGPLPGPLPGPPPDSDRIAPEFFLQFDVARRDVAVYARDDRPGVPATAISPIAVIPTQWGWKDGDEYDKGQADLRAYLVSDAAGNSTGLLLKVKSEKSEMRVQLLAIEYNKKSVILPSDAEMAFHWSFDGSKLKELQQSAEFGNGRDSSSLDANYDAKKNQTSIEFQKSKSVVNGLVLIRMSTERGNLRLLY